MSWCLLTLAGLKGTWVMVNAVGHPRCRVRAAQAPDSLSATEPESAKGVRFCAAALCTSSHVWQSHAMLLSGVGSSTLAPGISWTDSGSVLRGASLCGPCGSSKSKSIVKEGLACNQTKFLRWRRKRPTSFSHTDRRNRAGQLCAGAATGTVAVDQQRPPPRRGEGPAGPGLPRHQRHQQLPGGPPPGCLCAPGRIAAVRLDSTNLNFAVVSVGLHNRWDSHWK